MTSELVILVAGSKRFTGSLLVLWIITCCESTFFLFYAWIEIVLFLVRELERGLLKEGKAFVEMK